MSFGAWACVSQDDRVRKHSSCEWPTLAVQVENCFHSQGVRFQDNPVQYLVALTLMYQMLVYVLRGCFETAHNYALKTPPARPPRPVPAERRSLGPSVERLE